MWERRTAVACHNTGISLKPELPSGRLGLDATTRKRLLRWVLVVTLGEAVGFTVPAAVGVALTPPSWGSVPTLVAMVLAGSVEGALLGAAQADCLFRWGVLPVRRWWIVATRLGAAVAWSLGMLPSTLSGLTWTAGLTVVAGIGALILLTSLPLAQYFVLRDHVRRAALWIPINMVAWLLGIAWTWRHRRGSISQHLLSR